MINKLQEMHEHTKHIIDWASIFTVIGTLASVLPIDQNPAISTPALYGSSKFPSRLK